MATKPSTEQFSSFAQWFIHGIASNLSRNAQGAGCLALHAIEKTSVEHQLALQEFASALSEDMYRHPNSYAIPVESFPDAEKFNKKRLNVARIVDGVIFDYLYALGLKGAYSKGSLQLDLSTYDDLVAEKGKKLKVDALNDAFSGLGLDIVRGKAVTISSASSPHLCQALSDFAKACSRFKNQESYLFRRFDIRVLEPDYRLGMDDVLHALDIPRRDMVAEADRFLIDSRYKRKIESYQDFGYRLVYSNKSGVVCYVHVNSYFEKPLYAYVRWVLDTEQSRILFKMVGSEKPGYAKFIFDNICRCDPACVPGFGAQSPESCIARILVKYGRKSAYVCKDARWNVYNEVSEDFEFVKITLHSISKVLYEK